MSIINCKVFHMKTVFVTFKPFSSFQDILFWTKNDIFNQISHLSTLVPEVFLQNFSSRKSEPAVKRWQRVTKWQGERKKAVVTLPSNLTFMQTTGSWSDPWSLIGWYFCKQANQFWLVCLIVTTKGTWRIFLTSFILVNFASPPGRKIVCKINETTRGDSLLTVSRLSVVALRLALSFMNKNSKKNVWDQGFTHQKFRRNSY